MGLFHNTHLRHLFSYLFSPPLCVVQSSTTLTHTDPFGRRARKKKVNNHEMNGDGETRGESLFLFTKHKIVEGEGDESSIKKQRQ